VELVGEADEDNARTLQKLSVANVPAILRPISTGGTIISTKLPNLRGWFVGKLEEFPARKITHGGKIPRARCGFVVVFHTGRKLKRGKGKRKEYFQLVFISIIRAFESGTHQGRIISIRIFPNKPNRMNRHCSGKEILPRLPAAKSREGFQRGRYSGEGERLRATRRGKADRASLLSPRVGLVILGGEYVSGFQPMACGSPWQWLRIALPAIVRFLCSFPHTNTAPHQTKRHHGAYKRRLSYHMQGMDRGGQRRGGDGDAPPRGAGRMARRGSHGQRTPPQHDNHLSTH